MPRVLVMAMLVLDLLTARGVVPDGGAPDANSPVLEVVPNAAEMARTKAEEAERLYHLRDLAGALSRLREAFALYPSPKLHYNFGLVERALLRDVEAMGSFERFLAEAPDADPERRGDAARHLAELAASVVSVELHCDTSAAEVFIDGRAMGVTPLASRLRVSPGPHQVLVQKEGIANPFVQRIEGAAGSTVQVTARLAPPQERRPQDRRPVLPTAAREVMTATAVDRSAYRPLYQRGWFWAGVAALASTVGISAALMARSRQPTSICNSCSLGELSVDGR